jgi:hypothetical protein
MRRTNGSSALDALQSPCCTTWLTILPSGVVTVVLCTCSGTILICSYALLRSSIDRYFRLAVRRNMPSMSGRGDVIFCVFLFCSRKSTTTRICTGFAVLGLGINSMGTVFPADVTSHLPELRYSDVPAPAWPGSPGFGLALGGSGFVKTQAGPKAKKLAWPGLALA